MSKKNKLVTMKFWERTRKKLGMIKAHTGKPMTEIVDALATATLAAIEIEGVLNDDEGDES